MRGPKPITLHLEHHHQAELEALIRRHTTSQQQALRAKIVLLAHQGISNLEIARKLEVSPIMVRLWRQRWLQFEKEKSEENKQAGQENKQAGQENINRSILKRLADAPRSGAPAKITPEAYCQIMAIACQKPEEAERPISQWTSRELADEAIKRGIVQTISPRQVGRFLKGGCP
jgi:putative transposase